MEDVNRQVIEKDCPSFYTEKVKEPKKQPVLQVIARTFASVFRGK